MSLRRLDILEEYRSDRHDLIPDFYLPCLENSALYCRAVGYFSSSSLISLSRGLTALIRGGGKMRLIASPHLSPEDIQAISTGLQQRQEAINRSLASVLDEFNHISGDRLACLAWLLSRGTLEIKIAVPRNIDSFGLYHEKLGVFADSEDNIVSFTGSANESRNSFVNNFECLDVFCSWKAEEAKRALRKAENFEHLWHDRTSSLEIIDFPTALEQKLLQFTPDSPPTREPDDLYRGRVREEKGSYYIPPSPLKVPPLPRQREAIDAWEGAGYRGILAMATGTGKTITALLGTTKLPELDFIVIGTPTRELLNQWSKVLTYRTGYAFPLEAMGDSRRWREVLFRKLRLINNGLFPRERLPLILVGTYGELAKNHLSTLIEDAGGLPSHSLLIADEVHATGAGIYRRILREDFNYRLGLSATPIREYDGEGTERILDYFGGVVYEYDLEKAIAAGILCEYDYHVYVTTLDETEHDRYLRLSAKIARLSGVQGCSEGVNRLSIQRARIVKSAGTKLGIIDRIIRDYPPRQALIYCADIRQATDISQILSSKGWRVARYSSRDDDRPVLLSRLADGHLDALVAVKCLDEGVDIPGLSQGIILASDNSERQFIQRRGRILRAAKGKNHATLIDVLVVPPLLNGEVKLIKSEVKRAIAFARHARNQASVISKLVAELQHYGITYSDLL